MMAVNENDAAPSWVGRETFDGTIVQPIGDQVAVAFQAIDYAKGQLDFASLVLLEMPMLREMGASAEARQAIRDGLVAAVKHIRDAHNAFEAAVEISSCEGQA